MYSFMSCHALSSACCQLSRVGWRLLWKAQSNITSAWKRSYVRSVDAKAAWKLLWKMQQRNSTSARKCSYMFLGRCNDGVGNYFGKCKQRNRSGVTCSHVCSVDAKAVWNLLWEVQKCNITSAWKRSPVHSVDAKAGWRLL